MTFVREKWPGVLFGAAVVLGSRIRSRSLEWAQLQAQLDLSRGIRRSPDGVVEVTFTWPLNREGDEVVILKGTSSLAHIERDRKLLSQRWPSSRDPWGSGERMRSGRLDSWRNRTTSDRGSSGHRETTSPPSSQRASVSSASIPLATNNSGLTSSA
jgi:hypothetical protein